LLGLAWEWVFSDGKETVGKINFDPRAVIGAAQSLYSAFGAPFVGIDPDQIKERANIFARDIKE
jgi:hypothetical protein